MGNDWPYGDPGPRDIMEPTLLTFPKGYYEPVSEEWVAAAESVFRLLAEPVAKYPSLPGDENGQAPGGQS